MWAAVGLEHDHEADDLGAGVVPGAKGAAFAVRGGGCVHGIAGEPPGAE